ncbi:MAG: hypothetical protein QOF48_3109 [Verrucomicrobiota bacterium]|jgi:hypothetical protein
MTLLVLVLGLQGAQGRINVVTLPGRDTVQLTIYNSVDLTLVKETRVLTFRKGLNRLEFSWANTLIDPTSVEFKALNHADAVEVLDVSFPPRAGNTLEWRIQSEFAGEVTVEIRYFTSGIKWAADYVAEAARTEKNMTLSGQVRVTNNSGEDYENAQVRLLVGTVRLVEEIAKLARESERLDRDHPANRPMTEMLATNAVLRARFTATAGAFSDEWEKRAEIVKESLGEYFLFTVEGRDTIANGWSKSLPSFRTPGIPLTSYYKFEKERWQNSVIRFYRFTNSEPSNLGREPLPDGDVKAFRLSSADSLLSFVGRTAVKYIPIQESVELDLGPDLEVMVTPVLMNWTKVDLNFDGNGNMNGWTTVEEWEFDVQNGKDIDVMVDIRRNFSGDWSLVSVAPYEKVDASKVKFIVPLNSRARQKFAYELKVKHGINAIR